MTKTLKSKPLGPGVRKSVLSRQSVKQTPASRPAKTAAVPCPLNQPWSLGTAIFSEKAWQEIAHSLKLSGQELQVVRGIFDDHTEGAIADSLKISPHTIHTHCERLYRKVGVTGRVRLVLRVVAEYIALPLAPGTILPPVCTTFAAGQCPLRRK